MTNHIIRPAPSLPFGNMPPRREAPIPAATLSTRELRQIVAAILG